MRKALASFGVLLAVACLCAFQMYPLPGPARTGVPIGGSAWSVYQMAAADRSLCGTGLGGAISHNPCNIALPLVTRGGDQGILFMLSNADNTGSGLRSLVTAYSCTNAVFVRDGTCTSSNGTVFLLQHGGGSLTTCNQTIVGVPPNSNTESTDCGTNMSLPSGDAWITATIDSIAGNQHFGLMFLESSSSVGTPFIDSINVSLDSSNSTTHNGPTSVVTGANVLIALAVCGDPMTASSPYDTPAVVHEHYLSTYAENISSGAAVTISGTRSFPAAIVTVVLRY